MKKTLTYIVLFWGVFLLCSCDKERKPYEGDTQIAFELKSVTKNIDATTTSIVIPIQLIATGAQSTISASISVDSGTNCANAVTVPASVTINEGRFTVDLVIAVDYASLVAGSANKLILNLSASGVKVSANYNKATITLKKI